MQFTFKAAILTISSQVLINKSTIRHKTLWEVSVAGKLLVEFATQVLQPLHGAQEELISLQEVQTTPCGTNGGSMATGANGRV